MPSRQLFNSQLMVKTYDDDLLLLTNTCTQTNRHHQAASSGLDVCTSVPIGSLACSSSTTTSNSIPPTRLLCNMESQTSLTGLSQPVSQETVSLRRKTWLDSDSNILYIEQCQTSGGADAGQFTFLYCFLHFNTGMIRKRLSYLYWLKIAMNSLFVSFHSNLY